MSWWMIVQWVILCVSFAVVVKFIEGWKVSRLHRAYVMLVSFGFLWALGHHIENCILLYYPNEALYKNVLRITYLGMCAMGPCTVYLAWCYSGKYWLHLNGICMIGLFGISGVLYLFHLTNDLHHLFYTTFSIEKKVYGPAFYVFTIYSYLCFFYAALTMKNARKNMRGFSVRLIYLCILFPLAANTAFMLLHRPEIDFVPLAFGLMLICTHLILYYDRPVSFAPVAAKSVFDLVQYPICITNAKDELLYMNKEAAAFNAFQYAQTGRISMNGRTMIPSQQEATDGNHIISFTDITEYAETLRELNEANAELATLAMELTSQNRVLREQTLRIKDYAAEQQRMRIMTRLNREVRGLIEALEAGILKAIEMPQEEVLLKNIALTVTALETVRRIIEEYKKGKG